MIVHVFSFFVRVFRANMSLFCTKIFLRYKRKRSLKSTSSTVSKLNKEVIRDVRVDTVSYNNLMCVRYCESDERKQWTELPRWVPVPASVPVPVPVRVPSPASEARAGGRPRLAELGRPPSAPAAAPTRLPSNSMYDTHTNCRLSDGQPFHCLIVGYNTTRVVAIAWRSPWHVAGARWRDVGWRCGGGAVAAHSRRLMADAAPCTVHPAELPGTLLRQGRQGRPSGVLARICHGSEMFVSTT